jgi:hypothetical protein
VRAAFLPSLELICSTSGSTTHVGKTAYHLLQHNTSERSGVSHTHATWTAADVVLLQGAGQGRHPGVSEKDADEMRLQRNMGLCRHTVACKCCRSDVDRDQFVRVRVR